MNITAIEIQGGKGITWKKNKTEKQLFSFSHKSTREQEEGEGGGCGMDYTCGQGPYVFE